ncbi:hypothetical protein [Halomonas sp. THAF5a]|uniref:hypothetical protein n=1 Tax=Halomonas sp. THAF5a TaxID=2587844 RepID=UPI00126960D3|nr:hypothetical protein [Halomonas sp. THAF5a]
MKNNTIYGISILLLSLPLWADDWSLLPETQDDRVFYQAKSDEKSLILGCFSGQEALSFTLIGGEVPLNESLRHQPSIIVWITLPDRRTGRYAIDTEYLGGLDNALVGKLMLGEEGKQFFSQGMELSISSDRVGVFFNTGLAGSARAMQDFREVCRL